MALYAWLLPGRRGPAGYLPTGAVSRWQDTGAVRAELWRKADAFDDVRPCGDPGGQSQPVVVQSCGAATPPPAPFTATGEKRT